MIYVLLPAYNEEKSLDQLIPKLGETLSKHYNDRYRIIICNDGSKDQTKQKIEYYQQTYPIVLVEHKINRGLGETSRDLFEKASELAAPEDVIVRLDCDDTHEPEFIPRMVRKLEEGYDVVIASRFQPGGGQKGISAYRAFISRCANIFMKVFFPIKGMQEYSCGFRAYRAAKIQEAIVFFGNNFIQLKGLGFTCTLEKLIKLRILGARFAEVPFMLRYDQKQSSSKMVSSITTIGYLMMALLYHWPWGGWRRGYGNLLSQREKFHRQ